MFDEISFIMQHEEASLPAILAAASLIAASGLGTYIQLLFSFFALRNLRENRQEG
jgi:hypothetical protein